MVERVVRRRQHYRRSKSGKQHWVRDSWVRLPAKSGAKFGPYRRCPRCGARIKTVKMPNGGLVHFEGIEGLGRIKHPCLHIGEGVSRRRDQDTIDLFDDLLSLKSETTD